MSCARIVFLLTLIVNAGYGQVDTEFWFAPPEVTNGHGDRPVYLRISTLGRPSQINIYQPGRGNIRIATATVAANTTYTIDLTNEITNLETTKAAAVMRTGLRITSTSPVSAYYEVGAPWNSDIFTLKGRNALGNRFVIPGQNFYDNSPSYSPLPSSSFDIVATKDNTVVKIRPTKPLVGHANDTLIVVKLNAGETYSLRKTTLSAADNPVGTIVESNKPIAITIKDDSVANTGGGCRDILGDQLVPVEVAGTQYIVLKGFLSTPEYLFITATEDATDIFIGASAIPVARLSAGQLYRHAVTLESTYITANKTIYVMHVTGFGCEMGMAILPSINCKGSTQVGFSRTTNEFFGLNVLVRKEGISSFFLNGSGSLIPPSSFRAVPGTGDEWYAAQLSFSTAEIPVGQGSLISNAQNSFQIGIINGNATSTCRYGYFSAFSTLFIGDDLAFCEGEQAVLDAGPEKESYLWSTGHTSQTIAVNSPGEYWVKVEREECVLYDTIQISVKKGALDLGQDVQICPGDTALIDGRENFTWRWSDGSDDRFLRVTTEGKYWASVFDYTGCPASDTLTVSLKAAPVVDLGPDVVKCKSHSVFLDASYSGATYFWQDGATVPSRNVTTPGVYAATVTANGCSVVDSVTVENLPGPAQDTIYGTPSVCPSVEAIDYRVEELSGSSYAWFVDGGSIATLNGSAISVDWHDTKADASVGVLITDGSGCQGDTLEYPVRINVVLLPEIPSGPDELCLNKSENVLYTTPATRGSVYEWNVVGGEITSGQGTDQVIIRWSEGSNRLWIVETSVTPDTVCSGTSPELQVHVFRDTTNIRLNFVTVDTAATDRIYGSWRLNHPGSVRNNEVFLYRRDDATINWEAIATFDTSSDSFVDAVDFALEETFEYYLTLSNLCDESLATEIHNNIFLTGVADTASGMITLHWNHYFGWPEGVDRYEVWRKTEMDNGYRFMTSVPKDQMEFTANMANDAFRHQYIIRARQQGGAFDSWSTPLLFAFEHPVTIPNIITPNGDEYNEYFHISRIDLYHQSVLVVMDRWGKKVFQKTNYRNDWNGRGLSSGVYFYILDLKKDNKVYKGTLTIR